MVVFAERCRFSARDHSSGSKRVTATAQAVERFATTANAESPIVVQAGTDHT